MNKQDKLIILFDYYEELLTEAQKSYFIDYYFNNLSLAEISENQGVSRNAVSKDLKLTTEKLINYEEKLKLFEKDNKLRKVIEEVKDNEIKEKLNKILDE